jgi:26 proteasome complex subunit DSS1
MSSSSAQSSKPKSDAKPPTDEQQKEEEARPHLGVLEEDDEFEEFAAASKSQAFHPLSYRVMSQI